eukprot:s3391_g9.t2
MFRVKPPASNVIRIQLLHFEKYGGDCIQQIGKKDEKTQFWLVLQMLGRSLDDDMFCTATVAAVVISRVSSRHGAVPWVLRHVDHATDRRMAEAEGEGPPEDREANLKKIQEKLDYLMTKENLQEDSFIQMNMDAQMNIPICILAGHEKFEEMGKIVDVSSLYDAALKSENVVVDKAAMQVKPIIKSKRNTCAWPLLPLLLNIWPNPVWPAARAWKMCEQVPFKAGDRVYVWSASRKRWFDDGEIQVVKDQGSVVVRFNNAKPVAKEVPLRHIHQVLRPVTAKKSRDLRSAVRQALGTGHGPKDAAQRLKRLYEATKAEEVSTDSSPQLKELVTRQLMDFDKFTSWLYVEKAATVLPKVPAFEEPPPKLQCIKQASAFSSQRPGDARKIFAGCRIHILFPGGSAMSLTRKQLLEARLREQGGVAADAAEATHLVVALGAPRSLVTDLAVAPDVEVVTDAWLCDSLLLAERLPISRYRWRAVELEVPPAPVVKEVKRQGYSCKADLQMLLGPTDSEDLRAKVVDEFRTCSAAWAVRGDKWRSWQYKKAENLVAQARSSMCAQDLKSIGLTPKFVQKCLEIRERGYLEQAEAFRKDADIHALLELTRIHGVGPALAQAWLRCGVRSIADVRSRVDTLPGTATGAATGLSKVQRLGLRFVEDFQVPVCRSEVERIYTQVLRQAEAAEIDAQVVPCGAYRRGDALCGGITLVISFPGDGTVEEAAAAYLKAMDGILVADLSGASTTMASAARVPGDDDPTDSAQACLGVVRGCPVDGEPMRYRRCDFVFCRHNSLPFVTLQWTGSDGGLFNREMKRIAAMRGFHLSHTYMCKADREGTRGRQVGEVCRAGAKIFCEDERAIFAAIGLPYRRREVDAELLRLVEEAAKEAPEALRMVKMEFQGSDLRPCASSVS